MSQAKADEARAILRAINELMNASRWNEAHGLIEPGRMAALAAGDRELAATFRLTNAEIFEEQGEWRAAEVELSSAIFEGAGTEAEAIAWSRRGMMAMGRSEYGKAATSLLSAARTFGALGINEGEAHSTQAAAECHMRLGEYDQALSFLKRSSDRWHDAGDAKQALYTSALYADCLTELGRLDTARGVLENLMTAAKSLGDAQLIGLVGESARKFVARSQLSR